MTEPDKIPREFEENFEEEDDDMSVARIGTYSKQGFAKVEADAAKYREIRASGQTLKEFNEQYKKEHGTAYKTQSGMSLSTAYNTYRVYKGGAKYEAIKTKEGGIKTSRMGKSNSRREFAHVRVVSKGGSKLNKTEAKRASSIHKNSLGKAVRAGNKQSRTTGINNQAKRRGKTPRSERTKSSSKSSRSTSSRSSSNRGRSSPNKATQSARKYREKRKKSNFKKASNMIKNKRSYNRNKK